MVATTLTSGAFFWVYAEHDRLELIDDPVHRLDEDQPSRAWLADRETLVQARDAQADVVETGSSAPSEVPQTEDGYPIMTRMGEAMTSSQVPASLVASWP